MTLSLAGITPGASPIAAAYLIQFFNLLTGVMTDQPVTLKNTLRLGGNQATTDVLSTLVGVVAQTAYMHRVLLATGDTQPTFAYDKNGKMSWGAGGTSAPDTTLERVGATILGLNGALRLDQIATPSAPGANKSLMYFKGDGLPYFRSGAAGAETSFSGATNVTDPLVAAVFL